MDLGSLGLEWDHCANSCGGAEKEGELRDLYPLRVNIEELSHMYCLEPTSTLSLFR